LPKRDLSGFDFVVNDNTPLNVTWNNFETPIIKHTTIESDGHGEEKLFILRLYRLVCSSPPPVNKSGNFFVEQN